MIDALDGPRVDLLTRGAMRELITPRAPDSHKGDYGRVLIVAGSRGKTGAAHLAGDRRAALRRRPGHRRDAGRLPGRSSPRWAPEYMTEALDETTDGLDPDGVDRVIDMARDVIAIGPGLGQAPGDARVRPALVDRATMPLVIDADGLNAFAGDPDRLAGREGRDVIITPHPGEMARLVGMSTDEVQASRLEIARNFAVAHHVYVVLKGHRTLIATPDEKVFINPTGNPGHGDRRHRRRPHRDDRGVARAAARRRGRVQARGVPARPGRRPRGGRRRGSRDDAGDVAGHLGDAMLELTARRKVVERDSGSCRWTRRHHAI